MPSSLTPFIGRSTDIERVLTLLRAGERRLVSLSGPGGVGKTRLALQVAARVDESIAGEVAFVSLASITEESLVAATIAHAFNLHDDGDQRLVQRIVITMRERKLLLILDSFEQVHDADPRSKPFANMI